MDLTASSLLSDSLTASKRSRAYGAPAAVRQPTTAIADLPANIQPHKSGESAAGTRIIAENRQDLSNGAYRITRSFEREDGRNFTRIEEFAFTERGTRRSVIQQNPSGNITKYEEILDRENTGTFRRTQRFRDESGETATQITTGHNVTDPFILSGGQAAPASSGLSSPDPFTILRGTRLDLRA